jgi:hypothetical protein
VARASDIDRIGDERVAIAAIHRTGKDIPTRSTNITMRVVLDDVGQVPGSSDEDTRSGLTYSGWVHAALSRRADSRHRQRLRASRSTLERKAELDYGYLEDRTWGATLSGAGPQGGWRPRSTCTNWRSSSRRFSSREVRPRAPRRTQHPYLKLQTPLRDRSIWVDHQHRRCAHNYETVPEHHEAGITMIMTMSRRLARTGDW